MSSPSHTDLREELDALAETQSFSPDPAAWDRGRRARRRSRVARGAAALAVVAIVVGVGAISVRPEQQAPQPADGVRGGALPSRVDLRNADMGAAFETDYAIGRASVALTGNGMILVGAEDGVYHRFGAVADVVALSPDGYRVAWWSRASLDPGRISVADLRTGEITESALDEGRGTRVTAMTWAQDGSPWLYWDGRHEGTIASGRIVVGAPSETPFLYEGVLSPDGSTIALDPKVLVDRVPFTIGSGTGVVRYRRLPTDLYPDGAVVTPVGWADDDTLVAIIDPPPSDVTEHPRLALLSAPGVPASETTFREFLPRLPPESISFAVDLIPDLTGDPDQELTKDFTEASTSEEGPGRLPYALGGLVALIAGIAFVRMMQQRGWEVS